MRKPLEASWKCCARSALRIAGVLLAAYAVARLLIETVLHLPHDTAAFVLEGVAILALGAPYLCLMSRRERCRREEAEAEALRQAQSQSALFDIARLSFADLPREEFLGRVLERLLAVEWLRLGRHAAIFLADADQKTLSLRAYRGHDRQEDLCTRVAFGECICGRAARSRTVAAGRSDDPEHQRRQPGAPPHAHYAVPILSGETCLGVLQVNMEAEHPWKSEELSFLQTAAGLVAGILGRRAAEEDRLMLATAIEQASESVVITDPRGIIEYVNPAFTRLTGYSRDEAVGQTPRLLRSGRQGPEVYAELWRTIAGGRSWEGRLTDKKKDGTFFESETSITPVKGGDGCVTHYVGVSRDITAITALEQQMRRSQKMEAVGLLAGGIAHDFNNVLTTIVGYNYFILEGLEPGHPLRTFSLEIRRSAELAGSLTHQLLALGRHQVLQPQVMDANSVILSLGRMLKRLVGEDIEVDIQAHPALWAVRMDSGQLEQVVLNLVVNARDAMPKGGRLTLATANVTAGHRHSPDPLITLPPGRYVCLSVRDTGSGIEEAARAHLFEPFFTTKGPGRGTGLGLSTVMGIVKNYHGLISVESSQGRGTVFRVYLPRVEGGAHALVPGEIPKTAKGGRETIMVVEDNDALRSIIKKALHGKGYRVFSARDSEEAQEHCSRLKERIDLLLADVVLPDEDGTELARRLLESRPGMRVIFMSGYPGGASASISQTKETLHIEKPFSPEQLFGFVRRALDGTQVEML